jgi:hypothetical protein
MRRALLLAILSISPVGAIRSQQSLAVGSPLVQPERLARGLERYEIVVVRDGQERVMGTYATKVEVIDRVLLVTQETQMGQVSIIDSAWTDPVSFVPTRQVSYSPSGKSELRFEGNRVIGSRTPPGGALITVDETLPVAPVSGSLVQLMLRTLPLDANFHASFPVYRDPGGQGQSSVRVVSREKAPGSDRSAWKVELSLGAQAATIWIDDQTGAELRTEAQGPGGATMVMRPVAPGKSS